MPPARTCKPRRASRRQDAAGQQPRVLVAGGRGMGVGGKATASVDGAGRELREEQQEVEPVLEPEVPGADEPIADLDHHLHGLERHIADAHEAARGRRPRPRRACRPQAAPGSPPRPARSVPCSPGSRPARAPPPAQASERPRAPQSAPGCPQRRRREAPARPPGHSGAGCVPSGRAPPRARGRPPAARRSLGSAKSVMPGRQPRERRFWTCAIKSLPAYS